MDGQSQGQAQAQSGDAAVAPAGHVYAMTNAPLPAGNAIIHYTRGADGKLTQVSVTPTMGTGTGFREAPDLMILTADPLQSQQALRITQDHKFLMGVNAIEHTVAVFKIKPDGELEMTDLVDSGGLFPNTIGEHGHLVYVGNIGRPSIGVGSNIVGFRLRNTGKLVPIHDSTRTLRNPMVSLPAHVLFSPAGDRVVVSDLFMEELDVFPVQDDGKLGSQVITPSAGPHPLGMIFGPKNDLLVSESGQFVGSSVSSYHLRADNKLKVISPVVKNGQDGGCWLSITPDGKYVFSGNTFTPGTISTYERSSDGSIVVTIPDGGQRAFDPRVGTTAPLDSFVTADGRYMYQHFGGLGVIGAFSIGADGSLTPIPGGDGGGLPFVGSQGLDGF
ncbi:MAG TPA: beta-propeller fold lactonase family protein [Kofleriaceae bacterium]|nr:beta-propeller fold lactonase family protein [Kofleriaceae bacterium]